MPIEREQVCLLVLAGGKSRRMHGQNKGLMPFAGIPLFLHILNRLEKDLAGIEIIISANTQQPDYEQSGYRVISDAIPDQLGPLSGMYSGMLATTRNWILSLPCDIPLIPDDYITRMLDHNTDRLAWVAQDERQHPACCLLHRDLQPELLNALQTRQLAVHTFLEKQHAGIVDFSNLKNAFRNVNTPEQLAELENEL